MTQNQGSEPVPASRTGQLISARDMAMQKFEEGMRLISEASELCGLSLHQQNYAAQRIWSSVVTGSHHRGGRKEIDRKTWKRLFEETGMDRYWNHKQKKPLTNPFVRIRPSLPRRLLREHYSMHWLTDETPLQKVSLMFSTSLTEVSKAMPGNIQCQKACSSGIFPGVNVLRYNGFSQDNHFCLRDFENIVCICSDTPTPATGGGLSMVDRLTAMRNTEFTGEVSDENGWRCRLFENGNVHICIDSISLLNALNDLISIYFANQLPAAGKK